MMLDECKRAPGLKTQLNINDEMSVTSVEM
jgi:hypothetical protein